MLNKNFSYKNIANKLNANFNNFNNVNNVIKKDVALNTKNKNHK